MLRPSGTEPKLKYYFYAVGAVRDGVAIEQVARDTRAILEQMVDQLVATSDC